MTKRDFFRRSICILFFAAFVVSCEKEIELPTNDLEILPKDTGGIQQPVYLNEEGNNYGYYVYLPSSYTSVDSGFPLMVFLHGSGEKGNSEANPDALAAVLRNGPPKLIKQKNWNPPYPMIVISPQCHDSWWNPQKIHQFIAYLVEKYRVNESRIYITGLSMGGFGTFSYVEQYGDSSYVAAAVPVCGGGNPQKASNFSNIPVWAFHGDADKTVLPVKSIEMINAINELSPKYRALLTIYPGVGHNSWDRTYDGTGQGTESKSYDPFKEDIYNWMFKYKKEL